MISFATRLDFAQALIQALITLALLLMLISSALRVIVDKKPQHKLFADTMRNVFIVGALCMFVALVGFVLYGTGLRINAPLG